MRLALALAFGGLIGIERERRHRPAGFRTYMLVCLGAALTMLLSQYEALMLQTRWAAAAAGAVTDVSRYGAQVINGIGFLGAGTILVTGRQEVTGLTTAAGLWASACMGLAIGAGFYECVLPGFALVFLCVRVLPAMERAMNGRSRNMNLYVEVRTAADLAAVLQHLKARDIRVFDVDVDRESGDRAGPGAVLSVFLPCRQVHADVLAELAGVEGVRAIEEL